MSKSNLCEDKIAKKASKARRVIVGGLSEKSYEEISKKTGIAERSLHNYIGIHGDLRKVSFERVLILADVAGVKISFELEE